MKTQTYSRIRRNEWGISLVETVLAAALMIIGIGGVMALFSVAAMKNQSQGSQASRCTEYAQDKMEQLMALKFTDGSADTTQVPTALNSSGANATGLGGASLATTVGSTTLGSPVTGYFDYVTESSPGSYGSAAITSTKQSNSAYIRQWSITPTNSYTKTITVTVTSLQSVDASAVGNTIAAPSTTLVSQKTNF